MSYQSELVINLELEAEFFELFFIKLVAIVYNYGSRQTKSIYDILPYQVSSFEFGYLGYRLSFNIFSEIINYNE